jgi:hypothetical protein
MERMDHAGFEVLDTMYIHVPTTMPGWLSYDEFAEMMQWGNVILQMNTSEGLLMSWTKTRTGS